jgi:amino acid adenylation domain-containing protein
MWVLCQFEDANPCYNIYLAWRLRGALNMRAMQQTMDELVARHESLRTKFPAIEGQPTTQIVPPHPVKLESVDLQRFSGAEQKDQLDRAIQDRISRKFDLEQETLFRPTLFKLSAADHVLLLLSHHIITDGTSAGVLTTDLVQLYNAFHQGKPSPLKPKGLDYADYAIWQRENLTERYELQLEYWKKQMKGAPALLELPTDRARQAMPGYKGAMYFTSLEPELCAQIRALSRREGVTVFMTLLAALQTLLARYSGQEQVVVGSPIQNRHRVEIQKTFGFFINLLPLYTDLSGNPSFRDLLKRVREVSLGAFAHQDVPFGQIVQELHPNRNLGANPLVQAFLVQEQNRWRRLPLDGLETEFLWLHNRTGKFDLIIYWSEDEPGIPFQWEYNDLYDESTIARITANYRELLKSIVADPNRPIAEFSILTEAERQQVVVDWNRTQEDFPNLCLHECFEQQVQRTPNKIAVTFGNESITYMELNARANQLANYLRKRGVVRETLVGLSMERSIEMMVGLLGIQKAGGAYVPLDPAFPRERIAYIIADAKAPILITQESLLTQLPDHAAEVICLDADWDEIARESKEDLPRISTPENLIYVLYTSGSTGNPKGVQLEHRNVVNFLNTMRKQPGMGPDETLLAVTTLSFDIAGLELYLPLTTGARVVIASKEEAQDGSLLMPLIKRHQVTVMQATPATWRMLLDLNWAGDRKLKVLCGGEALPHDLAEQLLPKCSALWNMYGPTETTIWSSIYKVEHNMPGVAPIGRPIGNNTMYILDALKNPMPIGVPGELYIGGDGVARGYINRPDLTADKFIPDPFSQKPGALLYRTGDLARFLADGNIQFLGRADFQVKVRGFRIELGEIEAVLGRYSGIMQNVVVVREDKPGDKRLVAYMVQEGDEVPAIESLRQHLRQKLPEYMVPSAFMYLDEFPLTPNGKVDRRALPAPEYKAEEAAQFVAPRNRTEERLVEIWETILGVSPISVNSDFFELGGHSLLGSRLFALVEKAFGKKLPLATIFSASTVEKLAVLLGDERSSHNLVEIQAGGPDKPPFFFVHTRMGYRLLAQGLGPEQPVYVLPYDDVFNKNFERSLREISRELVSRLRAFQPQGPYYLGGMCLAGRVAYAIAQELFEQGEEVALLALFDAPAPGYPNLSSKGARARFFTQKIKKHLFNFSQQEGADGTFKNWLRWHAKNGLFKSGFKMSKVIGKPIPLIKNDTLRLMGRAVTNHKNSFDYPGFIAIFRPANQARMRYPDPDPSLGWARIAQGGVEINEIPGGHTNFLKEPAVHHVAKSLADCLRKAQEEAEGFSDIDSVTSSAANAAD